MRKMHVEYFLYVSRYEDFMNEFNTLKYEIISINTFNEFLVVTYCYIPLD